AARLEEAPDGGVQLLVPGLMVRAGRTRGAARVGGQSVDVFGLGLRLASGRPARIVQLVAHADLVWSNRVGSHDQPQGEDLRRGPHDADRIAHLTRELEAERARAAPGRRALPRGNELRRPVRRGGGRVDDGLALAADRREGRGRTRAGRAGASSRKRWSRSGTPAAPTAAAPRPASAARASATVRSGCEGRYTGLWYNRAVRSLVLDRYIVHELIPPFALGGALFTFFLIIDRIYHLTDLVVTKGVPFYLVVQLLVYMLPSFLAHTLPMALLVAILLAGGRLAGDLEIIALKAVGVSAFRLFRPVLAVALVVTAITAGLTLVVNPVANGEFQRQLFKIVQAR